MASFNAHASVAMSVSGLGATSLMVAGLASEQQVLLYFMLGTIGGLLPDLDLDTSKPLRAAFFLLALLAGFLALFRLAPRLSLVELCLVWLSVFLSLRYGVFWIFTRLTVHRGMFHSIPAALMSGFGAAAIAFHGFDLTPFGAWMAGLFISVGYLVHLILDEMSSVDVREMAVKRSFGTALKLFSWKHRWASIFVYVATCLAYYLAPDIQGFSDILLADQTLQRMQVKLTPAGSWFQ